MKKQTCLLLTLILTLTLSACGGTSAPRNATVNQTQTVSDLLDNAAIDEPQTEQADVYNIEKDTEVAAPVQPVSDTSDDTAYDVDLTQLGSTMVYSEVFNMMYAPEDYVGKTVKMEGSFAVYEGEGRNYYACLIADATACCAQGIEFVWAGDHVYPDDYPELGTTITVTGTFDTYMEDGMEFCQLVDAEIVG